MWATDNKPTLWAFGMMCGLISGDLGDGLLLGLRHEWNPIWTGDDQ